MAPLLLNDSSSGICIFYIIKNNKKKDIDRMNNITTCNVAFFDSEFTALSKKNRGIQEMIQCSLIVCEAMVSSNKISDVVIEKPLFVYSQFIKPIYNPKLSDYIIKLTGIKQDSVDNGISLKQAIDEIYDVLQKYNIRRIVTWGPDKMMLRRNLDLIECDRLKSQNIIDTIVDISYDVSKSYGHNVAIAQHQMCKTLKIKEFGYLHNAYSDALNLAQLFKCLIEKSADCNLVDHKFLNLI